MRAGIDGCSRMFADVRGNWRDIGRHQPFAEQSRKLNFADRANLGVVQKILERNYPK